MSDDTRRVDGLGRAYAGSQLQIQLWVNRRTEALSQAMLDVLPSLAALKPRIRWVSPLESEGFVEYQDREFLRAVGLAPCAKALSGFWPRGGPVWDALAAVETARDPELRGVLLVEAKSHVREVYGVGCKASASPRRKIEAALERTKRWLGVPSGADWTGALYQSANRLAHLYFFLEVAAVPAWLVNVYVVGDRRTPTALEEWQPALEQVSAELGLAGVAVPHAGSLFLGAGDRRELVESATGRRRPDGQT